MWSFRSIWPSNTTVKLIAVGGLSLMIMASARAGELSDADQMRLDHMLRHDCGSCHGMTMKGGLGPPLLPETLADHDEDVLVDFILVGNPARAMPPWGGLLAPHEVRWIVRRLKMGLGPAGGDQ